MAMNLLSLIMNKYTRFALVLTIVAALTLFVLFTQRLSVIEVTIFNNTGHTVHVAIHVDGKKVSDQDIGESILDAPNLFLFPA